MSSQHIAEVARTVGISLTNAWSGLDAVWPLLEKMRAEGAIVVIKLDGERQRSAYTVLASEGPLRDGGPVRTDAATIEAALAYVIGHYAQRVWNVPLPS
jgi:hypothetical protein